MNELAQAIAHLVNDWGWLLVFALFAGGGDAFGRALSGRRANQKLRGELKATKAENARIHELMSNTTRALGSGQGGDSADVAALAEQARVALDDRALVLDLLSQIQATDRAWPQLPQDLRDEIDRALLRLRARPVNASERTPR